MEKVDARKLGLEGRDTLREMVLRLRTQSGMKARDLAQIAGVHVRTVEAWLRKARAVNDRHYGATDDRRNGASVKR